MAYGDDEAAEVVETKPSPKSPGGGEEMEPDADGEEVMILARDRFEQADEAEKDNRTKQLDDMRFLASTPDDNYQWPTEILNNRSQKDSAGRTRPTLTINKMRSHQRQVMNEQRMNRPQFMVRPSDAIGSKEVAKVLNGWMRHIQIASEADLAYDTACEWQTGAGEGYFRLYPDYRDPMSFEQEIIFAPLADRMKVYLDPIGLLQHPAGRKCRWGFITEELPTREYEAQYGEEDAIDWNQAGEGDQVAWFSKGKDVVRVAEYFEIVETTKTLCEWKTPLGVAQEQTTAAIAGSVDEKRLKAQGWVKTKRERKTKIPRCIWRKMNGQKVLSKKEMPTSYVPIVRVVGNQWVLEGKLHVDGMVRPAKDAQRMYNFNASAEVEVGALQPLSPLTAALEQIKGHESIYEKANVIPLAYLPYNLIRDDNGQIVNVAPPSRVQPPIPAAAFIQAKIGADQDIKATMGQWGPSLGEPSGEKSGKAINARKVESDVGTFHYVDNLSRALKFAGCIALEMASEIIDSKRIVRILGEDGTADHIIVDPEQDVAYKETQGPDGKTIKSYNFAIGKYEMDVNTGPSFTTKRAEAAEFLTSAVQSAKDPATSNVLTYLAMKNQDWSGAEEATTLLKTLLPPPAQQALASDQDGGQKIPEELRPMIDQLKQALGHMKGQLEAATQAIQQRDQTLQSLETQVKSKDREAMVKMYSVDKETMAELTRAVADVEIAKANALIAASKQPENEALAGLPPALDQILADLNGKIELLAHSAVAIKGQLDNFEIAARMPQEPAAPSAPAAPMPQQQPHGVPA